MRILALLTVFACAVFSAAVNAQTVSDTFILKPVSAPTNVTSQEAFSSCKVFQRPDERFFRAIDGSFIRASGACPGNYVSATMLGPKEIELARHGNSVETTRRVCILDDSGSCIAMRLLEHPTLPSSTVVSLLYTPPAGADVMVRDNNHILRIGKPTALAAMYPGQWDNCMTVYTPRGTVFVTRSGRLLAISGQCPPHRFMPGKLIGSNEVQFGNRICKLSQDGNCTEMRDAPDSLPIQMPNDGTTW